MVNTTYQFCTVGWSAGMDMKEKGGGNSWEMKYESAGN